MDGHVDVYNPSELVTRSFMSSDVGGFWMIPLLTGPVAVLTVASTVTVGVSKDDPDRISSVSVSHAPAIMTVKVIIA